MDVFLTKLALLRALFRKF